MSFSACRGFGALRSRRGRAPLAPVLGVLAVVCGGVAALSIMQMGTLKQQLADREQRLAMVTAEREGLQQQLTELEAKRRSVETQLGDLRSQLSSQSGERERLRQSIGDLQSKADRLEQERSQLQAQVAQLTGERDGAQRRVEEMAQAQEEMEQIHAKLRNRLMLLDRDFQSAKAELAQLQQGQVKETNPYPFKLMGSLDPAAQQADAVASSALRNSGSTSGSAVELSPIVVRKSQTESIRSIRSRVIEANEAHGFVVIDKGSDDGIQTGMTFDIRRGEETVGQVTAIRVRAGLAACSLVGARSTGFPKVGDVAIQYIP